VDGFGDVDLLGASSLALPRLRRSRQVEEIAMFLLAESQSSSDGVEYLFGDASDVALLQAGVPLGADAREDGDLFASEAGNPAAVARRKTDVTGG
jgi:hypothetical protein